MPGIYFIEYSGDQGAATQGHEFVDDYGRPGRRRGKGRLRGSFPARVEDLLRSPVAASDNLSVLDLFVGNDLQGIGLHAFCLNFGVNLRLELIAVLFGKHGCGDHQQGDRNDQFFHISASS